MFQAFAISTPLTPCFSLLLLANRSLGHLEVHVAFWEVCLLVLDSCGVAGWAEVGYARGSIGLVESWVC